MTTESKQLRLHARSVGNEEPLAALELYDQAVAIEDASPGDVATALKDKAVTLALLGRSDEALALFCQVIETCGHSDGAQTRAAVDKSLMNKAVLLNKAGLKADAISCHDEVADRKVSVGLLWLAGAALLAIVVLGGEHATAQTLIGSYAAFALARELASLSAISSLSRAS
jgi:tetratricopeptide (TPR) repeat protein